LETRKLDPEMRGKNEDETDSSRFIWNISAGFTA
jgi:hypothetical protein